MEAAQVVFASWLFRRQTPMLAAHGGWLELPANTVCLEDLVTMQAYRRRGIAAIALMDIAGILAKQGVTTMIAKVEKHNLASCHTMEKAGFRVIATMDMERIWLKLHVKVAAVRQDDFAAYLAQHLEC
jgi:L-amino acid N-acyltransferase YncA